MSKTSQLEDHGIIPFELTEEENQRRLEIRQMVSAGKTITGVSSGVSGNRGIALRGNYLHTNVIQAAERAREDSLQRSRTKPLTCQVCGLQFSNSKVMQFHVECHRTRAAEGTESQSQSAGRHAR